MAYLRFPYQILYPFHLLWRHCLAPPHRWRHPQCRQAHWRLEKNSFAFKRNISPPTAIPKTKER